jgi:hypothetical protein
VLTDGGDALGGAIVLDFVEAEEARRRPRSMPA